MKILSNNLNNRDIKLNFANLFMYKTRLYAFIKKISPILWYTRPMTKFMIHLFKNKKLIGLEIGVEYGLNAKTMLTLLPIEKLYMVDPYINNDQMYRETRKYLAKYDDKTIFIRKTSENAANEIPDKLDFVYLDGAHTYEAVKKDIELIYNKIKKGGILGGHDFWANEIGVCKAVLEFVEYNNLTINGKLTDWWIVKE